MALGNGGGGTDGAAPIAEINITPLTDVMLVLLIIAMVAAPTLMYQGRSATLPKVEQTREFEEDENLLELDAAGQLYFNREPIADADLKAALDEQVKANEEANEPTTLLIAGSPQASYQRILDLMNLATETGVENLVLVGDVVDQTGASLLHRDGAAPSMPEPVGEAPGETTSETPAAEGPSPDPGEVAPDTGDTGGGA
ncbi:MAG TPA: biopolymer transporter ExbD [bacterium]|nr:biopolymer transporter ExbD [bacterium]